MPVVEKAATAAPAALPPEPAAVRAARASGLPPESFPLHIPAPEAPQGVGSVAAALQQNAALTGSLREAVLGAVRQAAGTEGLVPAIAWRERVLAAMGQAATATGWLKKALPSTGWVAPFHKDALVLLYAALLGRSRAAARERFRRELEATAAEVRRQLAADDARKPPAPDELAAGLGLEAGLFDTAFLSRALGRATAGAARMSLEDRRHLENALRELEQQLTAAAPVCWICAQEMREPAGLEALGAGWRQVDSPFGQARELLEQLLARLAAALRALRIARRLLAGESGLPEGLERLDWQSAEPWELEALPAIIALAAPGEAVDSGGLTALIRTRLPVHVLVAREGFGEGAALSAALPDPGALARSLAGAFVLESSLAHMSHLLAGLERMAAHAGPAVAVVNVPWPGATETHLALFDRARVFPLSIYDPHRGESWAERFQLLAGDGDAGALLPAEAAALLPACAPHLAVLPPDAPGIALREALAKPVAEPLRAVPCIDARNDQGASVRLGVSRHLLAICRERMTAWRQAEELAGIRNAHAERARAQAIQEMEAQAAARAEAAAAAARREGASQAIRNVVQALFEPSRAQRPAAAPAAASAPPAPPPSASPAAGGAAPGPPPAAPAPVREATEPYIDSFLCTSCNDCMRVNPRMFQYNANKQAYLADPSAGTFAELVKAAEGCPAKCIHVGTPRPGDATATPALVAKSARWR